MTVKGGSTTCHTLNNLEGNTPYIITVQATAGDSRKSALSSEVPLVTHAAGKSYTIWLQIFVVYKFRKKV